MRVAKLGSNGARHCLDVARDRPVSSNVSSSRDEFAIAGKELY
jgi:hypothetical protein